MDIIWHSMPVHCRLRLAINVSNTYSEVLEFFVLMFSKCINMYVYATGTIAIQLDLQFKNIPPMLL